MSVGPTNESSQTLIGFTTSVDLPNLFNVKPTINATTGTLTYTPAPHRNGTSTVTVTLQDNGGTLNGGLDASTQIFTITITGVDDPPLAVNDAVTVVAGSPAITIPILDNDNANNPDQGEVLTIVGASHPAHGSITVPTGGHSLRYRPAAGFHGSDRFTYTISDPGGHTDSATVLVSVPKDTFKPTVTEPVQTVVSLQTLGPKTVSVRISWTGSDLGAGIVRYELYRSKNGGKYVRVTLGTAKSRSATQSLSVSASYRFKVRAVDKVGNIGVSVAGPTFKVLRPQDTPTTALVYAGTWTRAKSTNYSGGYARASSTALDTSTYTFTGRNIAWVAARSTGRGSATILIDGLVVGTVNLQSTKLTFRRVVFSKAFGGAGPHTLQVQLVGTVGHPRVDVDAFVVLQ
jgi:hypothetical protein